MTDWIKGRPYTALYYELSSKYHLNVSIRQHQSGKVTIYQAVSKLIGGFDDLMQGTLDIDTTMMDKLNEILYHVKEA